MSTLSQDNYVMETLSPAGRMGETKGNEERKNTADHTNEEKLPNLILY